MRYSFQNNAIPHVFQEGKHAVDMRQFWKKIGYYAVIQKDNAVNMHNFWATWQGLTRVT